MSGPSSSMTKWISSVWNGCEASSREQAAYLLDKCCNLVQGQISDSKSSEGNLMSVRSAGTKSFNLIQPTAEAVRQICLAWELRSSQTTNSASMDFLGYG